MHVMALLGDVVKWKLVLIHLEIVLITTQDRCTVCAKCTIRLEIILGVPNDTLGDVGEVEGHFNLFGDSVSLDTR